jgi:large subunit ribosomal protein L30
MGKLKIRQVRSATSRGAKQRGTIKALGLRRIGQEVVVDDKPEIRGMVEKVKHLVEVEESDQ